ncbi:FAD-binding oxidoreductase [Modestobacter sp. SSW1-42]|uniref:FAD-binding oxidoreductase n=1 Tax=Modestobacter sp. SSW1-42 TaxID=596372 RepID=UPI003986C864
MTTLDRPRSVTDLAALRRLCGGAVHLPGDPGYDDARRPWNLAVDQRPAAVAYPASTSEVADVLRAAGALNLRVAPQGTGHNAGPLGDLSGTVLLRTAAMTGVVVDPDARRVTVRAGTLWLEAVEAAAAHGLAVLHGSSPDVGVVGYCLGGGMGWYARARGLAAHSIVAAELVLADGSVVRVDAEHRPDLLWALRGGGGNLGVVTELTIEAFELTTAHAGVLVWDATRAAEVLPAWVDWAREAPPEVTTSFRLLSVPPLPEVPAPLRGRDIVMVDGAVLADPATAAGVLAPLRALGPELDTFADLPPAALTHLHMDPEGPTPALSETVMVGDLPPEGSAAFLAAAPPGTGLMVAELRQLGGQLSVPSPTAALTHLDGAFVVFGGFVPIDPEVTAAGLAGTARLAEAMAPWATGQQYLNFVERPCDASVGYSAQVWETLRRLRDELDPRGVLHANHQVPTASTAESAR